MRTPITQRLGVSKFATLIAARVAEKIISTAEVALSRLSPDSPSLRVLRSSGSLVRNLITALGGDTTTARSSKYYERIAGTTPEDFTYTSGQTLITGWWKVSECTIEHLTEHEALSWRSLVNSESLNN